MSGNFATANVFRKLLPKQEFSEKFSASQNYTVGKVFGKIDQWCFDKMLFIYPYFRPSLSFCCKVLLILGEISAKYVLSLNLRDCFRKT